MLGSLRNGRPSGNAWADTEVLLKAAAANASLMEQRRERLKRYVERLIFRSYCAQRAVFPAQTTHHESWLAVNKRSQIVWHAATRCLSHVVKTCGPRPAFEEQKE